MNNFRQRLRLKERLRQVRQNQPSRTSEEAYAQMERMRNADHGRPPKANANPPEAMSDERAQ